MQLDTVRDFLVRGDLDQVFTQLSEFKDASPKAIQRHITLLTSNYARLHKEYQKQLITREVWSAECSKATNSVLFLLEEMEEEQKLKNNATEAPHQKVANSSHQDLISTLKNKFPNPSAKVQIPLLKKGQIFEALLVPGGISVSNLPGLPFLPWSIFTLAVELLESKGGTALPGDAMKGKLGDDLLPLDSIEGHIAHHVFKKQPGDSVFRRISPIRGILLWAGICKRNGKYLELV